MRPVPDAPLSVQRALQEIETRLASLESVDLTLIKRETQQTLNDLERSLRLRISATTSIDRNDVFRGGGAHMHGYVPDPGDTAGSNVLLSSGWGPLLGGYVTYAPPGAGGRSIAQAVVEVHGSLAVLSALSSCSVRTRTLDVFGNADIKGTLTVAGVTAPYVLKTGDTMTGALVLAGVSTAPTAAVDTNTTQIASTAFVIGQAYAKLAGPTFTGVPAAPTAAVGTSTTQLATTAFVDAEAVAKAGDAMTGALTVTTASSNSDLLTVTNTNSDSLPSYIKILKDGGSPANGDYIGATIYGGKDTDGNTISYIQEYAFSMDVSPSSKDSKILWYTQAANTNTPTFFLESGNCYAYGDMSVQSLTDRTPYPKDKNEAYAAVTSMKAKDGKLDHASLHPSIKSTRKRTEHTMGLDGKPDGGSYEVDDLGRNLSMTVSALAEVVKDLITRIDALEKKP